MKLSQFTSRLLAAVILSTVGLSSNPSHALINGTEDSTSAYGAVAGFGGGCSSVLVAPRVALTSAHCLPDHALTCTNLTMWPLAINFAEPNGGWSNTASFTSRTVQVKEFMQRPELFDLSQCTSGDTNSCADIKRQFIDHSKELVVLYLAADAPADVVPLPILIHPSVDTSHSAAEVGAFSTLQTWVQNQEPVVTTVGHGVGSHSYSVGANQVLGRDYGLQRWVEINTNYSNFLGANSCNTLAGSSSEPGVVASPKDLTLALVGDPKLVAPGANFPGAQHSHSGEGDSGGPVLLGAGIGAKGDTPTPLPTPGPGGSYDPNRNYVAGTASLWLPFGQEFATAFNPTWTLSASTFLMNALHDSDNDGYADPVDDDRDGDGCDNDVDQHPDARWVQIGTYIHPNCNPFNTPWLGDESIDSDQDGIPNCEDKNDDGDLLPDDQDSCPIHAAGNCIQPGYTCPWNPVFFDCRLAGCNELLVKFSRLINPDPTKAIFFRVLTADERVVTIAPAANLSLEQSAKVLAGGEIQGVTASAIPQALRKKTNEAATALAQLPPAPQLLTLEVIGPFGDFSPGRTRGTLAVYKPQNVRVHKLRGANALQLRFGKDGQIIEITGTRVKKNQ